MSSLELISHISYYYASLLQHFIDVTCSAGFPEGLLSTDLPPEKNFSMFIQTCRGLALNQRKRIFKTLSDDKPDSKVFRLLAYSNIGNFTDALTMVHDSVSAEPYEEQEGNEFKTHFFEIYIDPGNAHKEVIQELLEALSDLHCSAGGLGLEFSLENGFICTEKKVNL